MSFSYTSPSNSDRDELRFIVGDNRTPGHLLEDTELDYLLATYTTVAATAIPALDAMITVASQRVNVSSGADSITWSQRASQLRRLRDDLVARGYTDPAETAGGAVSMARSLTREWDTTTTEFST